MTEDKAVSLNATSVIESLGEEEHYKFLGVLEGVKQEERQSLQSAAKAYLQRLSSQLLTNQQIKNIMRVEAVGVLIQKYQKLKSGKNILRLARAEVPSVAKNLGLSARTGLAEEGGKQPLRIMSDKGQICGYIIS